MTASRLGMTLLSVATQLCEPESIDTVVLPIVADLQFEARASSHRSAVARAWVRLRGYVGFFKALALMAMLGQWRKPMKSSTLGWVRLALAVPAALLVTLLVQMAATRVFGAMLMHPGERLANGLVLVEGVNTTKIVSSPFVAAALFWTLYLVAPKHRRSSVAVAALVVIGLWAGTHGATPLTGRVSETG